MGENAEHGVAGEVLLPLQHEHEETNEQAGSNYRKTIRNIEQNAEGDTKQGSMRQGIAEIRHSAPDDETAERTGDQRKGYTGEHRSS
ncbi:hypothetical protein GCM10022278_22330 [Allohahella marinimesophila]|uniref:CsbD-like n=1 Tax=Allohahella marinimesophila TaxID=1054972 RepID=A0ABP7PDT0_9GAMM